MHPDMLLALDAVPTRSMRDPHMLPILGLDWLPFDD
jgi:hypothetical protein